MRVKRRIKERAIMRKRFLAHILDHKIIARIFDSTTPNDELLYNINCNCFKGWHTMFKHTPAEGSQHCPCCVYGRQQRDKYNKTLRRNQAKDIATELSYY